MKPQDKHGVSECKRANPHLEEGFLTGCRIECKIHIIPQQLTEWERIFANDISGEGLISKIYKELLQPNNNNNRLNNGQRT